MSLVNAKPWSELEPLPKRGGAIVNEGVGIDNDGPPKLENFGEVSPSLFYKLADEPGHKEV